MTRQYDDIFYLDGDIYYLPFPGYGEDDLHNEELARLVALGIDLSSNINMSSCWRRYVGQWEIHDELLYLMHAMLTKSDPITVGDRIISASRESDTAIYKGSTHKYISYYNNIDLPVEFTGKLRLFADNSRDESTNVMTLGLILTFENGKLQNSEAFDIQEYIRDK